MGKKKGRRNSRAAGFGTLGGVFVLALLLILSSRFGLLDTGRAPENVSTLPVPEAQPGMEEGLLVYFLDVGQGDSELIRIPGESEYFNVLIDTGEYAYADGLTDMLHSLGVERIDALVCSHPHTDHMGCMARIVQRFEIGSIYMPLLPEDQTPATAAYEKLLDAVEEKGLVITQLCEDAYLETPAGSQFQVMSPRKDAEWESVNNYSAVLRLVYGESSFLFTGDAEKESEAVILEDGYEVQADVLKCGHHGSKTSTSAKFLKAVAPEFTVISCGQDNRYGHPHKGTLDKLSKLGTEVFRTDGDGTVLARSDGKTITLETGLPSVESAG